MQKSKYHCVKCGYADGPNWLDDGETCPICKTVQPGEMKMTKKGNLTREQAVAALGEKLVNALERKNCEPTNRMGYNGACQGDDLCEWSASITSEDANENWVVLTAYYYTTNEQDQIVAENYGDGSYIDWKIEGFEINQ